MKKVFSIIRKLFIYAIVGLFSLVCSLALVIGIAEGDLSHGLLHYLQ